MSTMETEKEEYPDFCSELRKKTQDVHDKSDKNINMKIAVVLTDFSLWSEAIGEFYFVYQAIEKGMEVNRDHPLIRPIAELLLTKGVSRVDSFEADLSFHAGSDWKSKVNPSPPCVDYCDRVTSLAQSSPIMLVAYIHSMYMALLAGGQIIKKIVKRGLGVDGDQGLTIFEFDKVNRSELRELINQAINSLGDQISREEKDAIIEEKRRVFAMNDSLVDNIKPSLRNYSRLAKLLALPVLVFLIILAAIVYMFTAARNDINVIHE